MFSFFITINILIFFCNLISKTVFVSVINFPYQRRLQQFDKMSSAPVSCLPVSSKMSKAKKAIDEARDSQNRELDLVDKNVSSFDEMSGLRECLPICFSFCAIDIACFVGELNRISIFFTHTV